MTHFGKRGVNILLLVLALLVLLSALSGFFRGKKASAAGSSSLVFVHGWEGRGEILEILKSEYEEQNPGVAISVIYSPDLPYTGGISRDVTICDIIAVDPYEAPSLIAGGIIDPEIVNILKFSSLLFYNTQILSDCGFNRPPKTRSEFLDQARAVTGQTGMYAAALALGEKSGRGFFHDVYSWVWAGGILLADTEMFRLTEGGGRASSDARSTRELRYVLEFIAQLENEGLLLPGAFALGEEEKRDAFTGGKTAFMIGSSGQIAALRDMLGGALDYTAIPVPDTYTGKPLFGADGWTLAVPCASGRREEAFSFIAFLSEQSHRLAEDWAVPENRRRGTAADPFYAKAGELYISGELVNDPACFSLAELDVIVRNELLKLIK